MVNTILFIYNNYNREHYIIELLKKELLKKNPNVLIEMCTIGVSYKYLTEMRPELVFTYPITTYAQIAPYVFAKMFCHSKIVTFTTEGYFDIKDTRLLDLTAGLYKYHHFLVDYHLFWGEAPAKALFNVLLTQKKIKQKNQCKVFGNPMFEKDHLKDLFDENDFIKTINAWKGKKVLVLSAFDKGEYSDSDLEHTQDLYKKNDKSNKKLAYYRREKERQYRDCYLSCLKEAARKNQNVLFVLKMHPHEIYLYNCWKDRFNYIKELKAVDNILVIDSHFPVAQLFPTVDLMISYGSTSDVEAYIYQLPCIVLTLNNLAFGVSSSISPCEHREIRDNSCMEEIVQELLCGQIWFKKDMEAEALLKDYFNYDVDSVYEPSAKIADFLMSEDLKYHRSFELVQMIKMIQWWIVNKGIMLREKLKETFT